MCSLREIARFVALMVDVCTCCRDNQNNDRYRHTHDKTRLSTRNEIEQNVRSRYAKAQKGEADDFVPNSTSGLFAKWNGYRSRLVRRIGDGDRWMVGGLVSPGSTVRRLTSVRGFYYDVLDVLLRRTKERGSLPHTNPLSAKSLAPLCPVSLSWQPQFTPVDFHALLFLRRRRVYIMREKKLDAA